MLYEYETMCIRIVVKIGFKREIFVTVFRLLKFALENFQTFEIS